MARVFEVPFGGLGSEAKRKPSILWSPHLETPDEFGWQATKSFGDFLAWREREKIDELRKAQKARARKGGVAKNHGMYLKSGPLVWVVLLSVSLQTDPKTQNTSSRATNRLFAFATQSSKLHAMCSECLHTDGFKG